MLIEECRISRIIESRSARIETRSRYESLCTWLQVVRTLLARLKEQAGSRMGLSLLQEPRHGAQNPAQTLAQTLSYILA